MENMEQESKEMTAKQSNSIDNDDDNDNGSGNNVSSNNPAKPQSTIIQSANGVKIESKLNPAAKEFYPAYLLLQRCAQLNKCTALQVRSTAQQQNTNTDDNATDTIVKTFTAENKQQIVEIECAKMEQQENALQIDVKEEKKQEKKVETQSTENAIKANQIIEVIENEVSKSELAEVITENALETETKTGIATEEPQERAQKASPPPVECVGDVGDTVNSNPNADNDNSDSSEQQQHLHKQQLEQNASTFITYMHDANCDPKTHKPQASTRTSNANEQLTGIANVDDNREPKTTSELGMGGLSGGKHATVRVDKTVARLSSVMGRTKRISESLHNLSSTFKSKMESRKSESSARALARSSTTIPKTTLRMRKPIGKNCTADCNGLSKDLTKLSISKDAISLRSASSTEKNINSKSALQLSGGYSVQPNSSTTGTKATTDKHSTTLEAAGAKMKKSLPCKLPRETVASALRQSEAQKRRNLFPNDDPDSNIELSQFLFK